MKRIFESSGTGLLPASPEFAAWIAAQVEDIGKHCALNERPVLRPYRRGPNTELDHYLASGARLAA